MKRAAKANVPLLRQETQFTCMATSLTAALQALDKPVTEQDVNKVMGCAPMGGASWESLLATAQYFGMRGTLVIPATLGMLKKWTSEGTPVIIAWNPHGRPWSHASVVFDVDAEENVHIMDPNCPDPDTSLAVVPKSEFYSKWAEPMGQTMLIRRPAVAIEREITMDGKQVVASTRSPMDKNSLDEALERLENEAGVETDMDELRQLASEFSISTDETADKKRAVDEDDPQRIAFMSLWGSEIITSHISELVDSPDTPRDKWGVTNISTDGDDSDKTARVHGGLYGFTKRTQQDCESATGRLAKAASKLAKAAYRKDERSAAFLKTHAERSSSMSARILVAAMENMGPKFANDPVRGKAELHVAYDDPQPGMGKAAAPRRLGLYGFPQKVAKIGRTACSAFRDEANQVAMGLHQRRADQHEKITGFLGQHSKEGGCKYSEALLRYYPDAGKKLGSYVPETMDEWLDWEE